jgi:hypothetical protein
LSNPQNFWSSNASSLETRVLLKNMSTSAPYVGLFSE